MESLVRTYASGRLRVRISFFTFYLNVIMTGFSHCELYHLFFFHFAIFPNFIGGSAFPLNLPFHNFPFTASLLCPPPSLSNPFEPYLSTCELFHQPIFFFLLTMYYYFSSSDLCSSDPTRMRNRSVSGIRKSSSRNRTDKPVRECETRSTINWTTTVSLRPD